MDSGMISGIVTLLFVIVFTGIVWWAYSRSNKQRFEDAGRIPFDDDMPAQQGDKQ